MEQYNAETAEFNKKFDAIAKEKAKLTNDFSAVKANIDNETHKYK